MVSGVNGILLVFWCCDVCSAVCLWLQFAGGYSGVRVARFFEKLAQSVL